jgi:hypothetical protein
MPSRTVVRHIRTSDRGTVKQRERILQRALTRWLNNEFAGIDFVNDWASGAFLTHGQNQARMLLASDQGWVDLFIAEPRRGFHGMFLELKKEGATVYNKNGSIRKYGQQVKESEFLARQTSKGYYADFAVGLEQAKAKISWYLGQEMLDLKIF